MDGKDVPPADGRQPGEGRWLGLAKKSEGPVDCPEGLDCEWIPALAEKLGPSAGDYGNHDLADRPNAPKITNIVIHNTEASYQTTPARHRPDASRGSTSLRSSDGHIAQHLEPQDVGWHAGNWYVNSHSIGLEHEGFAATGRSGSASRCTARRRGSCVTSPRSTTSRSTWHIFGTTRSWVTAAHVAGMHWDPGPYWNWEHYFQLLGARSARTGPPPASSSSDPARLRGQPPAVGVVHDHRVACEPQGTNFVYLHQAPDAAARQFNDIGLRRIGAPATTRVSDIGARAQAGLEFAVAGRQGDWTAIWFNGVKGWFHNPPTSDGHSVDGAYVVPKAVSRVPVYGRAYPEASAYPAGIPVQALAPLQYAFTPGQEVSRRRPHRADELLPRGDLLARHAERPHRRRRAGPVLPDQPRPPVRVRPRGRRRRRHGGLSAAPAHQEGSPATRRHGRVAGSVPTARWPAAPQRRS